VSEKVLSKTSPSLARYIAANVWKNGGDIRDVINLAPPFFWGETFYSHDRLSPYSACNTMWEFSP
jgi:hypothetical protein